MQITTWTTRKGKTLQIKDMSTLHIQKCISMLKSNIKLRENCKKLFNLSASFMEQVDRTNSADYQKLNNSNNLLLDNYNGRTTDTINAFESELMKRGETYNPLYREPNIQ